MVKIQSSWRGWIVRSSRRSTAIMMPDVVGLKMKTIVMDRLQCEVCGIPEPKCKAHQLCDGCKLSLFCSRTCQKVGWKRHKRICFERRRSAVAIQSAWREMSRDREGRRKAALLTIRSARREKRAREVAHPNIRHLVEECVAGIAFVTLFGVLGRSYKIFLLPGFAFLFVTMKMFQDLLAKPLVLRFRKKPMRTQIHTASRIILKLLSNESTFLAVFMVYVCIWSLDIHVPYWSILMIAAIVQKYQENRGEGNVLEIGNVKNKGDKGSGSITNLPRIVAKSDNQSSTTNGLVAGFFAIAALAFGSFITTAASSFWASHSFSRWAEVKRAESMYKDLTWETEVERAESMYTDLTWETIGIKWMDQLFTADALSYSYGFVRYMDEIPDTPFFCHPYDAMTNSTWNVSWASKLDEDEIELVNDNMGKLAQFWEKEKMEIPIGFTSFAHNRSALSPIWFTWDDAYRYISLKSELLQASDDDSNLLELARKFNQIVPRVKPPIFELKQSGGHAVLTKSLMKHDNPGLQNFAALISNNVFEYYFRESTGIEDDRESTGIEDEFIEEGYVVSLVQLLSSRNEEIRYAGTKVLRNMAHASHKIRDAALSSGAMQPVIYNVAQTGVEDSRFLQLLSSLCCGLPEPKLGEVESAVPTVFQIISKLSRQ